MRGRRKWKQSSEHEVAGHERWLLSYADFVTLLLAVFIVLFAFSREQKKTIQTVSAGIHSGFEQLGIDIPPTTPGGAKDATKPAPGQQPELKGASAVTPWPVNTAELKKQLEGVLGEAIDKREIVVQETPEGLIVSLRDFGFFNSGEAELLPGAALQLKRLGEVLMANRLEVRVEGHSDDQPIHTALFQSNWQLSTARATSVLTVLLDDAKFPPARISVAGYGPYRPIADNSSPEGRRANRRVDLVIIEPDNTVGKVHP